MNNINRWIFLLIGTLLCVSAQAPTPTPTEEPLTILPNPYGCDFNYTDENICSMCMLQESGEYSLFNDTCDTIGINLILYPIYAHSGDTTLSLDCDCSSTLSPSDTPTPISSPTPQSEPIPTPQQDTPTHTPTPDSDPLVDLTECQISDDCYFIGDLETLSPCHVHGCVDGSCIEVPLTCPENLFCDNSTNGCVQCVTSDDCSENEYYATLGLTKCSPSSKTCVQCLELSDCPELANNTFCQSYGYCDQSSHVCTSNVTTMACDSLDPNERTIASKSFCDNTKERCTECSTDSDCINKYFPSLYNSSYPLSYCTRKVKCEPFNKTCVFAKLVDEVDVGFIVTQEEQDQVEYISLSYIHTLRSIQLNNGTYNSTLVDILNERRITDLNFDDTLYDSYIKRNPCDSLAQRNRLSDVDITACSNFSSSCNFVECQDDSDCSDGNECNGLEFCNTTTSRCQFPPLSLNESSMLITNNCPLLKPYCDINTLTCYGCKTDLDCEPTNVCDGIGVCNVSSGLCSLIERCKNIVETCDADVNITESLLFYGFSIEEIGVILEEDGTLNYTNVIDNLNNNNGISVSRMRSINSININNYHSKLRLYYRFKKDKDDISFKRKRELEDKDNAFKINTDNDSLSEQPEQQKDIPRDFDLRRIYCRPILCDREYTFDSNSNTINNISDPCPTGTLCKVYSPVNGTRKRCSLCKNDVECQDGIKCNGVERCHPEGTCRKSLRPLCYNEIVQYGVDAVTCLERMGSCNLLNNATYSEETGSSTTTGSNTNTSNGNSSNSNISDTSSGVGNNDLSGPPILNQNAVLNEKNEHHINVVKFRNHKGVVLDATKYSKHQNVNNNPSLSVSNNNVASQPHLSSVNSLTVNSTHVNGVLSNGAVLTLVLLPLFLIGSNLVFIVLYTKTTKSKKTNKKHKAKRR